MQTTMGEPDIESSKLFQLWRSKQAGRRFPGRRDFDVTELVPWMGNIGLLDIVHGEDERVRYRFRLVGTHFTSIEDTDITGQFADEVFSDDRAYVIDEYDKFQQTGAPILRNRMVRTKLRGANFPYHKLILPLGADGKTVDILMVHLYPANSTDGGR